jgi:hypothetical protein
LLEPLPDTAQQLGDQQQQQGGGRRLKQTTYDPYGYGEFFPYNAGVQPGLFNVDINRETGAHFNFAGVTVDKSADGNYLGIAIGDKFGIGLARDRGWDFQIGGGSIADVSLTRDAGLGIWLLDGLVNINLGPNSNSWYAEPIVAASNFAATIATGISNNANGIPPVPATASSKVTPMATTATDSNFRPVTTTAAPSPSVPATTTTSSSSGGFMGLLNSLRNIFTGGSTTATTPTTTYRPVSSMTGTGTTATGTTTFRPVTTTTAATMFQPVVQNSVATVQPVVRVNGATTNKASIATVVPLSLQSHNTAAAAAASAAASRNLVTPLSVSSSNDGLAAAAAAAGSVGSSSSSGTRVPCEGGTVVGFQDGKYLCKYRKPKVTTSFA